MINGSALLITRFFEMYTEYKCEHNLVREYVNTLYTVSIESMLYMYDKIADLNEYLIELENYLFIKYYRVFDTVGSNQILMLILSINPNQCTTIVP